MTEQNVTNTEEINREDDLFEILNNESTSDNPTEEESPDSEEVLEQEEVVLDNVNLESFQKHQRFKDADWYEYLKNKSVVIGGAGGIGSWVALFLSRIGCNLYVYDDDRFGPENMSGQFVSSRHQGESKVKALYDLIKDFSGEYITPMNYKFNSNKAVSEITISAFDNMKARKDMFNVWKNNLNFSDADKDTYLFVDGRLLAQSYQIFIVQGNRPEQIKRFEEEFLFNDNEVEPVSCTLKQTSHAAAGIASHMTGFIANFATNRSLGMEICNVPFLFEYITEPNFTKSEYV